MSVDHPVKKKLTVKMGVILFLMVLQGLFLGMFVNGLLNGMPTLLIPSIIACGSCLFIYKTYKFELAKQEKEKTIDEQIDDTWEKAEDDGV